MFLLHIEFDLCFRIIIFKESSVPHTTHISCLYFFHRAHNTELHTSCHLAFSLHAVVPRAIGVGDCPEELAGHEVLIHVAIPCIMKEAQSSKRLYGY